MKLYEGPVGHKYPKCPKEVAQAYSSWLAQKAKCYRKNHPDYKWYGAKGIRVDYGSRWFVSWWIHNLKLFNGKRPTCGRIDHDKNYCSENIVMQDSGDNARESWLRNNIGYKNKMGIRMQIKNGHKVYVICKKSKDVIAIIPSKREAANLFGTSKRTMDMICRGLWNNGKRIKKINFILECR
jgi:hypothetical protein